MTDGPAAPKTSERLMQPPIYAAPGEKTGGLNLHCLKPLDDLGYVFRDDLRTKLDTRPHEFHEGLLKYLALGGVAKFDCNSSTWQVTGGAPDAAQEKVIRAKFSPGSAALMEWEGLRDRVLKILRDGPKIEVFEASDADAKRYSRGAWAKNAARNIHINPRDMTQFVVNPPSPAAAHDAIAASFDGFWQIMHETLHITDSILNDYPGDDTRPGPIEGRLNLIRDAFGLPLRTTYNNPPSKPMGMQFVGGEILFPIP